MGRWLTLARKEEMKSKTALPHTDENRQKAIGAGFVSFVRRSNRRFRNFDAADPSLRLWRGRDHRNRLVPARAGEGAMVLRRVLPD